MSRQITIEVEPKSEIAQAVQNAAGGEITLVVGDRRFRMIEQMADERRSAYWKTTTVAEHFAKFEHLLDGIDPEELKNDIYRWRIEGSRSSFDE